MALILTVAFARPYSRAYGFFEVPFLCYYVLGVLVILVILNVATARFCWKEAREKERTISGLKTQLEEEKQRSSDLRKEVREKERTVSRFEAQMEETGERISHLQKQLQEQRIPFIVGLEHLTKAMPEFLPIIQKLFITRDRIEHVDITPLPGGYGGSITFVARIKLKSEDQLLPEPFVLKLGVKREMKDEEEKWKRYIENRFVDAPRPIKYVPSGDYAGVSYTFAGLGGEIQNFHKFYEGHFHTEIVKVIGELYQNTERWSEGWPEGIKEITDTNLYDEYHLLYKKRDEIVVGVDKIVDRDDPYRQNFYAPTALLVPGLKPRFCDNLPQMDEHWCDPVYFVKTRERKRLKVPFYRSIIHGDLHSGNILIEMRSGKVWLIDFSHTGNGLSQERTDEALREELQIDPDKGHILKDFCRLEADIKFILTALENQDDFNMAISFEKELMARGLDLYNLAGRPQKSEVLKDPRFEKAWECIGEIRRRAKKYLHQPDDLRPYYLSLFHATLPIVYYEQCSEWQKKYALVSAGMLCDRLTS
jgi:hypothetical protein